MSLVTLFPARKAATTFLVGRLYRGLHVPTASKKTLHNNTCHTAAVARYLSTAPPPDSGDSEKKSSYNPFSGMWENYQGDRTKRNFKEQMEEVAAVETWNLAAYRGQLAKTAKSWKASVPGLRGTSEVKSAKEGYDIVDKMILEIGEDADVEDLHSLGQLQKLKIANEANLTVERLNSEIKNFEASAQTYRLMRMLKKKGKDVPETPDETRQLLMVNAKKLMTKPELKRMEQMMRKSMMNRMK